MRQDLPVWRSLLYVPAHVEKFVASAHTRGSDAIILDLEDAVPPAEKARARGLVSDLPHPVLGTAKTIGQPVRFDGEKPIAPRSAPALGADGPAILARLGIAHG